MHPGDKEIEQLIRECRYSDEQIAVKCDCSRGYVFKVRKGLGLPSGGKCGARSPEYWGAIDPLLGTMADTEVAKLTGATRAQVKRRRARLGIQSFHTKSIELVLSDLDRELGTTTDAVLAERFGVAESTVRRRRHLLNIKPCRSRRMAQLAPMLGVISDSDLAIASGLSVSHVAGARRRFGKQVASKNGTIRDPYFQEFLTRMHEGCTHKAQVEATGLSKGTVWLKANEAKVLAQTSKSLQHTPREGPYVIYGFLGGQAVGHDGTSFFDAPRPKQLPAFEHGIDRLRWTGSGFIAESSRAAGFGSVEGAARYTEMLIQGSWLAKTRISAPVKPVMRNRERIRAEKGRWVSAGARVGNLTAHLNNVWK